MTYKLRTKFLANARIAGKVPKKQQSALQRSAQEAYSRCLRWQSVLQTFMAHVRVDVESLQINPAAQIRPADVLDNGITNKEGVDEVQSLYAQPKQLGKAKTKGEEAVPSVPYFKLFRSC